jgi:hypothetical protein
MRSWAARAANGNRVRVCPRTAGTLVISPDNESRRELNGLIHAEMQERGAVGQDEHKVKVLDARQDMTSADRA